MDLNLKLRDLANKLTTLTPIKSRYLNRQKMSDDIYNKLIDFMEIEPINEKTILKLSKDIYFNIILGVEDNLNHNIKVETTYLLIITIFQNL